MSYQVALELRTSELTLTLLRECRLGRWQGYRDRQWVLWERMNPARFEIWLLALALTWPGTLCTEKTRGSPSMGRCSLFGDDFINTFDETMYSFAGSCSYLLAGDCQKRSFSILGNFQDGKRVSLSVYLGEFFDIHLFVNGTVMQGDQSISMPYASKGLYLEAEAGYYKLSSEAYGFVAKIDGDGNFQVLMSDRHFNKTCGLREVIQQQQQQHPQTGLEQEKCLLINASSSYNRQHH
ncbi:hypothetical protein A6R68_06379 [Neotoma lepida]|uniref:VWFD domain-containing protein n=1 Tax=Neotoma lepida TaxID=56216 RepID=A0A1A6GH13_NEOLE|nr:hypothetical protein A6R68_06379 [Neotoma lepida]